MTRDPAKVEVNDPGELDYQVEKRGATVPLVRLAPLVMLIVIAVMRSRGQL